MKKLITLLAMTLSLTAMADSNFSCFGTEPFWNLKLEGENVTFTTPDDVSTTEQLFTRTSAAGVGEDFAFIIETNTGSTATVLAGECNDGMSDNVYSHQIVYKNATSVLYGCCNEIK